MAFAVTDTPPAAALDALSDVALTFEVPSTVNVARLRVTAALLNALVLWLTTATPTAADAACAALDLAVTVEFV